MENRKKDHIELALTSRTGAIDKDNRFDYEPLLAAHPDDISHETDFLGFKLKAPLWVSSMTGGTKMAGIINRNLARACNEFGMGMGLGSCRIIMEDDTYFEDFNVKDIIGDKYPLFANLGIAQVELLIKEKATGKIPVLLDRLKADGLVVHVNPMQEWVQPEGDRLGMPPAEVIECLTGLIDTRIIVKEVGQGMGPGSLRQLLQLKIDAIEFAAFGGTNFAKVELERSSDMQKEMYLPFTTIGNTAGEMLSALNELATENEGYSCKNLIISGGVKNFLDGYYYINRSKIPAIYGQASAFLKYARDDYDTLREYMNYQLKGLSLAKAYLKVKK
jgi:isopentenyl-diphosphate delta-isomerase